MKEHLKELWKYRYLIPMFVERDLKARYKQTSVGFAWAIIQPFFMMVVLTVIFSKFLNVSSEGAPYPVFSYAVLVPWMFFQRSVSAASESFLASSNLVTKIYFPREIIPLSTTLSALLDFFIAFSLFLGMLIYYKIPISSYMLAFPLILVVQITLGTAFSLLFSSFSILFRDLRYALPLLTQIWMYGSPVIYGISTLQENYQKILFLNPVTGVLQSYRDVFLFQRWDSLNYFLVSTAWSVVLLLLSYHLFKKIEYFFIDFL